MTFKIKLNYRGADTYEYAKTETSAKQKARLIARKAARSPFFKNGDAVSIIYVEDCLGGLRAEYRVDDTRYIMGVN